MKKAKYLSLVFGAAMAVSMNVAAVDAKELKYNFGGSESGLSRGADKFAEVLAKETDGRYTATVYIGNLFVYSVTNGALREGHADVGFLVAPYFRAKYTATTMISDIATARAHPASA